MSIDLETQLRSLRWTVPPEVQRHTLDAAATALRETTDRVAAHRRWWRRAALLLLSLGALSLLLLTITTPPALTLAAVRQAMAEQRWVHIKYDNGREQWTNLTDGRVYFRDHDGRAVYTEPTGVRLAHFPDTTYISKDHWYTGTAPLPSAQPTTPWDQFVAGYETGATQPADRNFDQYLIQRVTDRLDSRSVVRFDCLMPDGLGGHVLTHQVWADPTTRLPVQDRQLLPMGYRQQQHRDSIVGRYDFPATGPTSIYDLGVARTDTLVDDTAPPAADVASLFSAATAAAAKFPTCYRTVEWEQQDGSVNVLLRDGFHERFKRYFTYDPLNRHRPFAADPDSIAAWATQRIPVEEHLADGHVEFTRLNPQPEINNGAGRPSAHVMSYLPTALPEDQGQFWFVDHGVMPNTLWNYLNESANHELIKLLNVPPGILVLRSTAGERRTDYWIDPDKNYICVRSATQKRIDGFWKDQRVGHFESFLRLPMGQWIPTRYVADFYGLGEQPADHITYTSVTLMWMKLLSHAEVPPATFDGPALLRGADVNTY